MANFAKANNKTVNLNLISEFDIDIVIHTGHSILIAGFQVSKIS